MNLYSFNGLDLIAMIKGGAVNLSLHVDEINALNVFPVPDGDTGTNMKMTIDGVVISEKNNHIGIAAKAIARSMVLSARGNSGVILSQFFKGFAMAIENDATLDVEGFAKAFIQGTNRSYSVVSKPTEGTILTVMREAGEKAYQYLNKDMDLVDYLKRYLDYAKKALAKTPELLPVLKKAGVVDSGGAGFILIIEGILKVLAGEEITFQLENEQPNNLNVTSFTADSELTYGYCTEFILQLQNSKVNPQTFDLKIILTFLETIGNSIVAFKDEDIIKVHVHTFEPGLVLTECRKYGEFVTLKIENMNVSHTETQMLASEANDLKCEHKKIATVAVASGIGLVQAFKDMGVDAVVSGGQTMNTSTEDFLKAFKNISADYIFVYPNNRNILMAAQMAADNYYDSQVIVIPTKTIAEGYSAISMLDYDTNNIEVLLESQKEVIANIKTLEVTYAVRDANLDKVAITKGQYIAIYEHEVISADFNRITCLNDAFSKIRDLKEKQVITIICGQTVDNEEVKEISAYLNQLNPFIEVYVVQGDQDIYAYIIGIE